MNQTEPGLKGLGGSITFQSLSRLFPGVSKPTNWCGLFTFCGPGVYAFYRPFTRQLAPALLAGVLETRFSEYNVTEPGWIGTIWKRLSYRQGKHGTRFGGCRKRDSSRFG